MKDGGPAFPHDITAPDGRYEYAGMSLRDYFAAAALQGYRHAEFRFYTKHHEDKFSDPKTVAEWAYADADAMIARREKE